MSVVSVENYILPEGRSLGLKVVYEGGVPPALLAPKDFRWNLTLGGETEAPDWSATSECGGGLHLWAWAQGDLDACPGWYNINTIWLAVEYETSKAVDLRGKVKVPRCKTVAVSRDRKEITAFIKHHKPEGICGSGLYPYIVEVEEGEAGVEDGGVAIVRGKGNAKAGRHGKAVVWDIGTAEAGNYGEAIVGDGGTAKAGFFGRATAGERGTAIAGKFGYAQAGKGGKAKAGIEGFVAFQDDQGVTRRKTYIAPDLSGLKPDTFYRLDDSGNFVEAGE